jgi:hypothetical protein
MPVRSSSYLAVSRSTTCSREPAPSSAPERGTPFRAKATIIDCHGHYITEPQQLHEFRKKHGADDDLTGFLDQAGSSNRLR